jgi:hypothetical protein
VGPTRPYGMSNVCHAVSLCAFNTEQEIETACFLSPRCLLLRQLIVVMVTVLKICSLRSALVLMKLLTSEPINDRVSTPKTESTDLLWIISDKSSALYNITALHLSSFLGCKWPVKFVVKRKRYVRMFLCLVTYKQVSSVHLTNGIK